jgi:hypothetical protein
MWHASTAMGGGHLHIILTWDVRAEVRHDDATVAQPARGPGGGAGGQNGLEDQPDHLRMWGIDDIPLIGLALRVMID